MKYGGFFIFPLLIVIGRVSYRIFSWGGGDCMGVVGVGCGGMPPQANFEN